MSAFICLQALLLFVLSEFSLRDPGLSSGDLVSGTAFFGAWDLTKARC